jgi:hypothetical protein
MPMRPDETFLTIFCLEISFALLGLMTFAPGFGPRAFDLVFSVRSCGQFVELSSYWFGLPAGLDFLIAPCAILALGPDVRLEMR